MDECALKAGHRVLATARNPTKAAQCYPQVAALGGRWLQIDVTSQQTREIVEEVIIDNGGKVDVVINNTTYGLLGSIEVIRYD
jgi:short-subunit dehydrogenase